MTDIPVEFDKTVTAGVAAIKGTYDGSCALSDLRERESNLPNAPSVQQLRRWPP